jgi:hypothetical protein
MRTITAYNEALQVSNNGEVFHDSKLVLELEEDLTTKSDQDITDLIETALYYDYMDNKN